MVEQLSAKTSRKNGTEKVNRGLLCLMNSSSMHMKQNKKGEDILEIKSSHKLNVDCISLNWVKKSIFIYT